MRRSTAAEASLASWARGPLLVAVALTAGCASRVPGPAPGTAGPAPASAEPGRAAADTAPADTTGRGPAQGRTAAEPRGAGLPRREPYLRVGLAVDRDSVELSAAGGLVARDLATGSALPEEVGRWTVRRVPGGLEARPARSAEEESDGQVTGAAGETGQRPPAGPRQDVLFEARRDSGTVRLGGHDYRGGIEVLALPGHGLVLINRVRLEDYLLGVVPLEIGPRAPDEGEAVQAQAVAARTYALANLGRRDSLGFDVFGSVEDQVYGGVEAERPESTSAVRDTRGQVLTWKDRPIRAYYHADGGGRTARVDEVWNLPDAPYLQSIADTASNGEDWGASDPHHVWRVSWTGEQLSEALAAGLSSYYGSTLARPDRVTSVRVLGRTPSGRVARLEIRTAGGRYVVERNDVRFVLRRPDGRVLPSTLFRVEAGPAEDGGRLVLQGRGNGHGVGMCQWGAIGRARAGQTYVHILSAYYPGAQLRTVY